MRRLIIVGFFILLTGCASTPQKFASSMDAEYGLTPLDMSSLAEGGMKTKAAFIYTLLYNTSELRSHQMNGEVGNKVYIHDDGREAVFDKNGDIVDSCANMGSYNYYHPQKQPLGHFSSDIIPWFKWGNCREQATTMEQRLTAYIMDINDGLIKVLSSSRGLYLPENFDFKGVDESQTIAFFISAIEKNGFDLDNFIMNNLEAEEERRLFLNALKEGVLSKLKDS